MDNGTIKARTIIKETERVTGTVGKIKSKTRLREIVVPRQLAMYLIRKYCKMSLAQIGTLFTPPDGKPKDHATVLHSCREVSNMIETGWIFNGRNIAEIEMQVMAAVETRVNPQHFIRLYRYSY